MQRYFIIKHKDGTYGLFDSNNQAMIDFAKQGMEQQGHEVKELSRAEYKRLSRKIP